MLKYCCVLTKLNSLYGNTSYRSSGKKIVCIDLNLLAMRARVQKMIGMVVCLIGHRINFFLIDIVNVVQA